MCRPKRIGYFCNEDKNLYKEAVSIKKRALALADESGISLSEEDSNEYSLLYLEFVFSYRFDIDLAYNAMLFHVYNDYAHETCIDAEAFHQLAHAIVSLAARSFVCNQRRRTAKSRVSIRWNKFNLGDFFSSIELLTSLSSFNITLYIPGLD
jgi:hypothetical protein